MNVEDEDDNFRMGRELVLRTLRTMCSLASLRLAMGETDAASRKRRLLG